MSDYQINFNPSIEKDLRVLSDSIVSLIMKKILELDANPYPHNSIKISGTQKTYRIRVRDYRIIYEVDMRTRQI